MLRVFRDGKLVGEYVITGYSNGYVSYIEPANKTGHRTVKLDGSMFPGETYEIVLDD